MIDVRMVEEGREEGGMEIVDVRAVEGERREAWRM